MDNTHLDAAEVADEYVLWRAMMPTPVPQELAAKVGSTGAAEPETGLSESGQQDASAGGLTLSPTEVRPGSVPDCPR